MSKFYSVAWASPLGDKPDEHGNHWQTIVLDGHEPKVAILVKNEVKKGEQLYGRVEKKEKRAGGDYYRFYKEMVPEGVERPQQTQIPAESSSNEVLTLLKEIHAVVVGEPENEPEQATEPIEDEPMDVSEIPF